MSSLESDDLKKLESSKEFHILRPLCVAIVQNPSEANIQRFQDVLPYVKDTPAHLAEYVIFPFALQLKMLGKHKDKMKTKLLTCTAEVLEKFEVQSWEMFIEMFQRLHIALGKAEDPTQINPRIPEDELDAIISCILILNRNNLQTHFKSLYEAQRIQVLAHSIVIMLQVVNSDMPKIIRLKALEIVEIYLTICIDKEAESRRFFKFLPGIVSGLRKTVDVRIGRVQKDIFVNGMHLMEKAITVTTKYENEKDLEQPDTYLAAVLSEISKELVLSENSCYRRCVLELSHNLLENLNGKMPQCQQVLLNNLMILRNNADDINVKTITETFSNYTEYLQIHFEDLLELAQSALTQLQGGDGSAGVLTLAKLSSYLTLVDLNYFELKQFFGALFSIVCEANRTRLFSFDESSTNNSKCDPTSKMCLKICRSFSRVGNFDDIVEVFDLEFSNFDGGMQTNFLGCVICFNELLHSHLDPDNTLTRTLTESEVLQFSNYYISMIDMQSTELVQNVLETEAPKVQSMVDVRKALLLDGLGIMAKIYPNYILPSVLYSLTEYAGLSDSSIVNESAKRTLTFISKPQSVKEFLQDNLSYVLNDLGIRIVNLSLYPNSPNVLIYLAEYFDFSQTVLIGLVDQVMSRSCDPFNGGNLQYLYSKVFHAFVLSLWTHQKQQSKPKTITEPISFLEHRKSSQKSLLQRMVDYQKSLGIGNKEEQNENPSAGKAEDNETDENAMDAEETKNSEIFKDTESASLSAELRLVKKICHRILNFLPNSQREVRLLAMDCLITSILVLQSEEDTLLPLAHTIWQNLVPRFAEKDYVVVRKSFELLLCLCTTCGSFLKKRILDEIFPKLSVILLNLAVESEQVKEKNRKYYTYTQAYKLQLTVLKGMAEMCQAIDIQEEDLDKIIDGCILYLKPHQHKTLQETSRQLIDNLVSENSSTKSKTIWMKLVAHGLRELPGNPTHSSFVPVVVQSN